MTARKRTKPRAAREGALRAAQEQGALWALARYGPFGEDFPSLAREIVREERIRAGSLSDAGNPNLPEE
jgi:hypothetical protein